MPGLAERRRQAEVMDQPGLDRGEHTQALEALRRINRISLVADTLWKEIRAYCKAHPGPVRLLDVATGGGDLPIRLARKARAEGIDLEVSACDISPVALAHAEEQARVAGVPVRFFLHDGIAAAPPQGYNILTSTLFLHHLDEPEAIAFLRGLGESGDLVLVDDLERSRLGYWLAWLGVRLLSRSKVAHVDGPMSVEGAFTLAEARRLADEAGWTRTSLRRRWPCRFLLIARRP